MIRVYFFSQSKLGVSKSWVEMVVRQALLNLPRQKKNWELSVALVADRKVKILNKRYRHHNQPTDVLAFSGPESKMPFFLDDLGEIIIASGVCQRQARKHQHSFKKEFTILLIHGLLHLFGYDHLRSVDANKMEKLEAKILSEIYG